MIFIIGDKAIYIKMSQIKTNIKISRAKKIKGFTLVELVVALGIFVVILTITTSILLHSLRSLRHIAHQASAMDNISLAMEQMARELRMGADIAPADGGGVLRDRFSFMNHERETITYSFCGARMCRQGAPITMGNTIIRGGFLINNDGGNKTSRITITAQAEDARGNVLGLVQTTISARLIHYKQ